MGSLPGPTVNCRTTMITELTWLETKHFLPTDGETVLLAWPRKTGTTYRTGRFFREKWMLSDDTVPHERPTYFAHLKEQKHE